MTKEFEIFQDKQIDENATGAMLNLNMLAAGFPVKRASDRAKQSVAANPQEADSFELKTGHKVACHKDFCRIVDADGNTVNLAADSFNAEGKLKSANRDANGAASAKFQDGSSVNYDPAGRVTVIGKNGDTSSFRVDILPRASDSPVNNMFQNIRR